jgi:hypothetical protein
VSNSEFKNLFPDEVKKSVSIINNDFGETNFVNRWVNFIQKSAEKYENFHTHQPNLFSLIPELLSKYKTKKRVARKLNIMNIPPPEGEKGWNYILIEKYLG